MKLTNIWAIGMSLALLTGAFAGTATTVFAQGKQKAGAGARQMSPLVAGLKAAELTDAQKASVKELGEKMREERKALMQPGATPDAETRKKRAELEAKELAAVKALLTPEQLPKFDVAYDAAKANRGGDMVSALLEKLTLTDAQKTELAPIMKETSAKIATLRADETLTRRDKAGQMLEIWNAAKTKIRPTLTPDQQKLLDEMQALRGAGKRPGGKKAGGL